jgi:hypothetical protein
MPWKALVGRVFMWEVGTMRRAIMLFAVAALVGIVAMPASARPMVRGETYKVDCEAWGVIYADPAPNRGIIAWENGTPLGSEPNLQIAAGIWFPGETIPPADQISRLSGRDASLCEITGPLGAKPADQLDVFAYFVQMPGSA